MKRKWMAMVLAIAMIVGLIPINHVRAEGDTRVVIDYAYIDGCAQRQKVAPSDEITLGVQSVKCIETNGNGDKVSDISDAGDEYSFQWFYQENINSALQEIDLQTQKTLAVSLDSAEKYGIYICKIQKQYKDELLEREVTFRIDLDSQFSLLPQDRIQVKRVSDGTSGTSLVGPDTTCNAACELKYQWYYAKTADENAKIVGATAKQYEITDESAYGFYTVRVQVEYGGEIASWQDYTYQIAQEGCKLNGEDVTKQGRLYYDFDKQLSKYVFDFSDSIAGEYQWQGKRYDTSQDCYIYENIAEQKSREIETTSEELGKYISVRLVAVPFSTKNKYEVWYSQDILLQNVDTSPTIQFVGEKEPRKMQIEGTGDIRASYSVESQFPKQVHYQWILYKKNAESQWKEFGNQDCISQEYVRSGLAKGEYKLECRVSYGTTEQYQYVSRTCEFKVVSLADFAEVAVDELHGQWDVQENNEEQTWRCSGDSTWSKANQLQVTFSDDTDLSNGIMGILNADGTYNSYSGTSLAGKTIPVDNNKFVAFFYGAGASENYTAKYEVTKIEPAMKQVQFVITGLGTRTYTGGYITQNPIVSVDGVVLKNGTDYKVTYQNNVYIGVAKVLIEGLGNYTGSKGEASFIINPISMAGARIKVKNATYTGKDIKVKPTVTLAGRTLKLGRDYTLSYSSSRYPGLAKVYVRGNGHYSGRVNGTFYIYPGKGSLGKLSTKKRSVTIKWNKVTGVSGYELYCASSSKGKYKRIKTTTSRTYKLTKQKPKKRLYFKVRAYKKINGKKIYGSYSSIKSIKVKK